MGLPAIRLLPALSDDGRRSTGSRRAQLQNQRWHLRRSDGLGKLFEAFAAGEPWPRSEGAIRRSTIQPWCEPRFSRSISSNSVNTHLDCAARWSRNNRQPGGANAWNGPCGRLQRLPAIAYAWNAPGAVSGRWCGDTDYSATRFGHCEVLVNGYVGEVVISCAAEVIARHPRHTTRLRSAALSVLAGAKDQRAGSGGSLGRLAVAAGVRRSPPPY